MTPPSSTSPSAPGGQPIKVVVLSKRNVPLDEQLLRALEGQLQQNGFAVFIDRQSSLGVEWAKEIERRVAAYERGEVETFAAEDVFAEARRLAP